MLSDRDRGDEAIDQLPHRGTPATARAVQFGRRLEVGQPPHGEAGSPISLPRSLERSDARVPAKSSMMTGSVVAMGARRSR